MDGEHTPTTIRAQYLLLVRHGPRVFSLDQSREDAPLDPYAHKDIAKLARWAAETLRVQPHVRDLKDAPPVQVTRFISSDHLHCIQTAKIYSEVFGPLGQGLTTEEIEVESSGAMATPSFWRHDRCLARPGYVDGEQLRIEEGSCRDGSTVVLCGHQPHLSWLFNDLRRKYAGPVRRHMLGSTPLPLGQSEAALVQLYPKVRLIWAIGKSSDADKDDVRDKIKAKMDTAKFVSGFVAIFLGVAATAELPQALEKSGLRSFTWIFSLLLLLSSLGFTLAALLAFDRLLMPSVFWGGKRPRRLEPPSWSVARPPSPVHWVLGFQMMHIWRWLFQPAVYALAVASASLVFALLWRGSLFDFNLCELDRNRIVGCGLALAILAPFALYEIVKPRLGYDD